MHACMQELVLSSTLSNRQREELYCVPYQLLLSWYNTIYIFFISRRKKRKCDLCGAEQNRLATSWRHAGEPNEE